ncbi:MAG: trypsin-like peptidase domain-containing protein [Acaryochloridaceae cyanobacterium SU_2_1]|nr:trypsin-like peptidase domain-containing protein [Acaryochloridaceae cyanobacterium SU_2_1]
MGLNAKFTAILGGLCLTGTMACLTIPKAIALTEGQIEQVEGFTVVVDSDSPGSGVIINKQGKTYTVLTAEHVVRYPDFEYKIITKDKQKYPVNYQNVKKLPGVDLAVITFTSDHSYSTAQFAASGQANILAVVYVAGYPDPGQAIADRLFQFTKGEVTGQNAQAKDGYSLVYSNLTRKGMSGGPVINDSGQLVGIHGRAETDLSEGIQVKAGFNLGIPIKTFLALAPKVGIKLDTKSAATATQPSPLPPAGTTSAATPVDNLSLPVAVPGFQPGLPSRPRPIRPNSTNGPVCAGSACN